MSWAYQPGLRCSQRSSSYGARRPMLAPRCPAIGRVGPGLLRDPSPRSDELAVAIGAVSQHSDAAECQEGGLAGLSRQTEGWGSRFAKSLLLAALVAPTLVWGAAFPAAARAKHEPVSTATLAPSHITSNSAAAVRTIPQQAAHTAQAVQAFLAVPQNQAVAGVLAALMLGMAFARARAQEASTKVAATAAAEVAAPAAAAAVGATVHTPVAPTTPAIASSATPAATSHAATAPAAALTSAPVAHPASHFANFAAARAAAAAGTASPAAAAAAPSPPQVIAVSAMRAASAAPPAAAAPAPAAPATAAPDVMPAAAAAAPPFARSPSLSPEASPALALSDLNRASQLKGLRAQHTVMAAAVADAVEVSVPAVSVAETVAVSGGAEDTLIVSNVVAFNLARAVAGRKAAPLPYYASLAPPSPPTHPLLEDEVEALAVSPVPAEEDAVPVSETVRQNLALAAKLEILHQLQREGVITRSSPLPCYASLSPTPPPPPKQAPPPPQQAPVPAPTAVQQQQQQPPPGVVSSPAAETRGHVVGDAVQHWSDMVKSSPISALEAVSEARALADAVISEVDGVAPLAAATAAALASPKPPDGWMWAWLRAATASVTDPLRNLLRVGPPGPPSKYDMVRFGPWTAPTSKSKWDPLSNMAEWDAPKGPLPAWDPLARLRELAPKRGVDGVPLPRSKYDAIGQLVDFLQELPQLVNSAEWSKASAADPVRFLLADVARRPSSRLLAVSHKPWAPPAKRRSKWRKYDPLAGLLAAAAAQARWEDVVADMLQLEAVCGPQVPQFSPIKVMAARDGKAFAEALADFKKLAVSEPGAAQFAQQFPALRLWLQAASNVSLATCAGGVKLGPVWGLLQLPTYQDTLKTARDSLPAFMRHLQRKHYPLYSLLRQGDPHQILTLLAILAAWVVADEMDTTGKAPASLLPPPPLEAAVVPPPPEEVRGLFGGLRLPGFPAQALAGFGPFANAGKMFAPATTSRNAPPS